jgi:hypothetical protein
MGNHLLLAFPLFLAPLKKKEKKKKMNERSELQVLKLLSLTKKELYVESIEIGNGLIQ